MTIAHLLSPRWHSCYDIIRKTFRICIRSRTKFLICFVFGWELGFLNSTEDNCIFNILSVFAKCNDVHPIVLNICWIRQVSHIKPPFIAFCSVWCSFNSSVNDWKVCNILPVYIRLFLEQWSLPYNSEGHISRHLFSVGSDRKFSFTYYCRLGKVHRHMSSIIILKDEREGKGYNDKIQWKFVHSLFSKSNRHLKCLQENIKVEPTNICGCFVKLKKICSVVELSALQSYRLGFEPGRIVVV